MFYFVLQILTFFFVQNKLNFFMLNLSKPAKTVPVTREIEDEDNEDRTADKL